MLAGELRLGGADVVVLDRRGGPTTESRASTLHARTMEILDCRGLLDALGTPPSERRGHFAGIPLDLDLPTPYPGQWKVPQTRTEELLQAWARELGADVRREHELSGVTVAADHVTAEVVGPTGRPVRIRARYAVGCDGERSTLRRLIGARFPGRDAGRELLRADVAGIDIPDRRFQRLPDGLSIAARRGDGVTRVMVHAFGGTVRSPGAEPGFADVADAWKRVTGEDIGHGTPLWVNAFGDARRLLDRYRTGRVLFAGDAAHQQMPIGGQALNLGLQDAFNLGWKLAAEVTGTAPAGLLDSYHDERHPVGRRILENIGAQAALLLGGPEVEPVRAVLAALIDRGGVREHLAAMVSGIDVRYDIGDGHPLLGVRLPYARLSVGSDEYGSHELLRSGRGVLLGLTGAGAGAGAGPGDGARLRALARPWADRIRVVAADPAPEGPLSGVQAVLVRPDGHVAWADAVGERQLSSALRRWFGEPSE
ncbi:FAD-dependent monooxygenase [Streptomyces sp. RerS4]|nr:FAD-dependent monooxygenase [Streptomyces sp. RerS4]